MEKKNEKKIKQANKKQKKNEKTRKIKQTTNIHQRLSDFMGYLIPKPSLSKNSSGSI